MRRLAYTVALALVAVLVIAPGARAQQMNGKHMMPDGTMMNDSQMMGGNTMASPSASTSATPSASDNGRKMGGTTMMSTSASASASSSASATPTATASAPQSHHHGGGRSSVSAVVDDQLPDTGGASVELLVSVGALVLLGGFGLAATRLLRRST
jgi:LPXTG-motif cell wall-anchored protein